MFCGNSYSMYLKDPHATLLQSTKHRDIQSITENIHQELKDATLGYALMTFLDENNLGSGPRMVTQSINPRAINLRYTKSFKRSVTQKGLQNKKVENAIILGVEKGWLDTTSLQPMHEGVDMNMVAWCKSKFSEEEAILYNGNHRLNYMKTEHPVRLIHH